MAKLSEMLANPARYCSELRELWKDAKFNKDQERIRQCEEALNRGCPGRNTPQRPRRAGSRQTTAMFKGKSEGFDFAKDAYIWLIERFIRTDPTVFTSPDHRLIRVAVGRGRYFFARRAKALFPRSPHLADTQSNFHLLTNGWFANANLDNNQKFTILIRFGDTIGLMQGRDWGFQPDDPTEKLQANLDLYEEIQKIDVEAVLQSLGLPMPPPQPQSSKP